MSQNLYSPAFLIMNESYVSAMQKVFEYSLISIRDATYPAEVPPGIILIQRQIISNTPAFLPARRNISSPFRSNSPTRSSNICNSDLLGTFRYVSYYDFSRGASTIIAFVVAKKSSADTNTPRPLCQVSKRSR